MNTFQIGDIIAGNNSWIMGLIGARSVVGVIIHTGLYSSIVHLFTSNEDITLMNDYIDKLPMDYNDDLKIGDLVELKPTIKHIISIRGVGTILGETVIRTSDFDGKWTEDSIHAFLVYFPEEDYEYTIPCNCLQLFSITKND